MKLNGPPILNRLIISLIQRNENKCSIFQVHFFSIIMVLLGTFPLLKLRQDF